MSTHTPGPWEVDTRHGIAIRPCAARLRMPYGRGAAAMLKVFADARLIAAAPEMLEALKRAVDASDDGWLDDARAAIAKAIGEA